MTRRELAIAVPLVVLAIVFGVAPQLIFNYITPTVNRQVETLAEWTRSIHDGHPAAAGAAAAATDNGTVGSQARIDSFSVGGGR
jgi:hypothetical protein